MVGVSSVVVRTGRRGSLMSSTTVPSPVVRLPTTSRGTIRVLS
jgi:hypothetical protein